MIKKITTLVLAASVISAGLLYLGTAMIGQYSPALAASLNALVARAGAQDAPNAIPAGDSVSLTVDLLGGEGKLKKSSTPKSLWAYPVDSGLPREGLANLASTETTIAAPPPITATAPITATTIAQLLKSPHQFIGKVFTFTGIATRLGNGKFLLNDGTGQILVEAEDDLIGYIVMSGLSITVMGKLDDSSSQSGFYLEAWSLTNHNGTVMTDDCPEDDLSDDCSDNSSDDDGGQDDRNDDDRSADDSGDDDGSDDSSDDDGSDDSSDDDGSDDSSDDDGSDDSGDDGGDD